MIVRYENEQSATDPLNGTVVGSPKLKQILESRRGNAPFFARFTSENGFEIMIGIGRDVGCVQYNRSDGMPPYLMAVSSDPPMRRGCVEFLVANTPTPVAARYIISFGELKTVALYFLKTGKRCNAISWQVLDPKAVREDMERSAGS